MANNNLFISRLKKAYEIIRYGEKSEGIDDSPKLENLPSRRISEPDANDASYLKSTYNTKFLTHLPDKVREAVKTIRALSMENENVSQVIQDITWLCNTGHKIYFDSRVSEEQADRMRNHLENKRKNWSAGQAGTHGIINKMIAQLLIGGAISTEWVPTNKMDGIESICFVNPEQIYFQINKRGTIYEPHQKPDSSLNLTKFNNLELIKLNPNTYKYYALNGDTDLPNGFPPYYAAIERVATQLGMKDNLDFMAKTLGMLGFLEVLVDKPQPIAGDHVEVTASKNQAFLKKIRNIVLKGTKDGVVAGFKDDHQFKFNSFAKDYTGANEIFKLNELQLFSALKYNATLAGRDYNTSEALMNVIFIKTIAQLKNIQALLSENLEFGYRLELLMAGYNFEHIKVVFNRSTTQDELKFQQAEEIKIRNVTNKIILGMVDQNGAANELNYDKPAHAQPLVPIEMLAGGKSEPESDDADKNTKNKSAKKSREKDKNLPKD